MISRKNWFNKNIEKVLWVVGTIIIILLLLRIFRII